LQEIKDIMEKKLFHLNGPSVAELSDQQLSDVLFSNQFRIVGSTSQFAKEQPGRYKAAQKIARVNGRLGTPTSEILQEVREGWNKDAGPRQYAEETLLSRGRWPEPVAKATLADGKALSDLKRDDPRAYAQLVLAATSYGMATSKTEAQALDKVRELASVPEITVEPTFQPSCDMTRLLGLPADQRLSLDSFNAAVVALHKIDEEAKARAISAKAAAVIEQEDAAAVTQ
jgi:hypothetical protein